MFRYSSWNGYSYDRQYYYRSHNQNTQLLELCIRDGSRRVQHHVAGRVVLREGDEVADGVGIAEHGAHTVETEGEATVRRSAVLEGTVSPYHQITLLLEKKETEFLSSNWKTG